MRIAATHTDGMRGPSARVRSVSAGVVAAAAAIVLSGCSVLAIGHPHTTASSTPTPTPTVTAAGVPIPADCTSLVAGAHSAASFTGLQVNDPTVLGGQPGGALTPTAVPTTGTAAERVHDATVLRCIWENPAAGTTSMSIEVSRVPTDLGTQYLDERAAESYATSASVDGGRRVQRILADPHSGVQLGDTAFLRDDVLIHIVQSNVPTNGLLDDIVAELWQ